MIPAASPLEALLTVHRDGLGSRRVRLQDGALVFSDPADRELCAGAWRVIPLAVNRQTHSVTITIPAVDPMDRRRDAA